MYLENVHYENPLGVKYFEPSAKGNYQILNETVFDVFVEDLNEQIPPPKERHENSITLQSEVKIRK